MVKKIILVFKTHFDIGFTDLSSKVIDKYANSMLKEVIATCKATTHMGQLKYIWTMPSWPLKVITEQCSSELKKDLDYLIEQDQIVWHALPYTSHTDFCSAEECIEGLRYSRELSDRYHKPYPISAKMTDVPGHGIMLPTILSGAGVKFLHLGCNAFATPPKLPFLFYWQSLSGEKVLTMYSKGGYGTPLLPPKDWKFPVWMALMQTNDNCGPQSASVIENYVNEIHEKYPDVEVVCGTMDDFYKELSQNDLSDLPVISKDLADTWIHGIGAYPKETGMIRGFRNKSKRLQGMYAKQLLEKNSAIKCDVDNYDIEINKILNEYFENINLFEEHTWGADVKTWLGPNRVYHKDDFIKAKNQNNYRFMEESWQEQRVRATLSNQALHEMQLLMEKGSSKTYNIFNPNSREYTGWVSLKEFDQNVNDYSFMMNKKELPVTKINGEWACFVEKLPVFKSVPLQAIEKTIDTKEIIKTKNINILNNANVNTDVINKMAEVTSSDNITDQYNSGEARLTVSKEKDIVKVANHRYSIAFSESTGNVLELFDKKLDTVLMKQQNEKSIFSYQYDRYGIEDVTAFLRDYAYRYSTWGIQDYGREAYPECEHKTYHPIFTSYVIEQDTVIFNYKGTDSVDKYGDAKQVQLQITLPPVGDELFVNVKLIHKEETPYIESGSLLFPFTEQTKEFRINKSNAVLDPSKDIQEGANHVLYCLENYISAENEQNGLCIVAKDTPLVSLGDPGIYQYRKTYREPKEPIAYFNLFNNMWGTNFPQWISGDINYQYILFGYDKSQEDKLLECANMLQEGVELTNLQLEGEVGRFPEHMQLINVRKEHEGIILRFKDVAGVAALRKLYIKHHMISVVNLNNEVMSEAYNEELEFQVKPYGIYSFLVTL